MESKLENLISGYGINQNDADGLRCLVKQPQERVVREVEDAITQSLAARPHPATEAGEAVAYACHIDLEEGMEPDACVLDLGRPEDCVYARKYGEESRQKCGEWKPVKIVGAPTAAQSRIAELEALCNRLGDEYENVVAQLAIGAYDGSTFDRIAALESQLAESREREARMRSALCEVSLASQNSMSSKEQCGRIARAALAAEKGEKE